MPKKSKNSFTIEGDTITIKRDDWDRQALASYREDYYQELKSFSWRIAKSYPTNTKLGSLHRYIMAKWYGEDVLKDMTAKGYVVDHMNNDHMDCRICNLEFLKGNRNVAKGQYFDKEIEQLRSRIAVSLFKDFSTGYYQITIGCNDHITLTGCDGKVHQINEIKLLYNCEYPLVVLDAERILTEYESSHCIELSHLNHCDCRVVEAKEIILTEEEKDHVVVIRDGVPYLMLGEGKALIHTVHYDENWTPPRHQGE